jgi:hypothetical protein
MGVRVGIKVYPPSKIFGKLVNKNTIKHQKGVPSPQNFHNPHFQTVWIYVHCTTVGAAYLIALNGIINKFGLLDQTDPD